MNKYHNAGQGWEHLRKVQLVVRKQPRIFEIVGPVPSATVYSDMRDVVEVVRAKALDRPLEVGEVVVCERGLAERVEDGL